jgi:hypothetical protein
VGVFTAPIVEAGSYRLDVVFLDEAGTLLGSYFEYIQVLPRTLDVRLKLSRRAVSSGGTLKIRVENFGTHEVRYGDAYTLQQYRDGRWQPAPQQERFFTDLHVLGAGRAGRCQVVRILKRAEPGLYRIQKEFKFEAIKRGVIRDRYATFSKTFRVR